jgi:hypothetical protein
MGGAIPSAVAHIFAAIRDTKISLMFDKYETDEQFEEKFIQLVEGDSLIKIIFIDDLDRCEPHKVMETLETIKTYLDVKTCIFIIACADEIVRQVVESERKDLCKKEDGNNYLNKFFQYTIRIPPFIHQNMREYASKILTFQNNDLLHLKDIEEILDILIHKDVSNPRKVISLINSFASDYELILKREESDSSRLSQGEISTKLSVLAVFTVIKNDFPKFYDLILKDNSLLKYIILVEEGKNDSVSEDYYKEILSEIYEVSSAGLSDISIPKFSIKENENEKFVDFVNSVADLIKDIETFSPFIYLDADIDSYKLGGGERLRDLSDNLKHGLFSKVKVIVNELKKDDEKKNLFNTMLRMMETFKGKRERKQALKCILEIIESIPDINDYRKQASKRIFPIFSEVVKNDEKTIEELNFNGIMFILKHLESDSTRQEDLEIFINLLNSTQNKEIAANIMQAIMQYHDLITLGDDLTKVKKALSKRKPTDEKDKSTYYTLSDICNFVKKSADNVGLIEKFFCDGFLDEICGEIIAVDTKKEADMDANEKSIFNMLFDAFTIIEKLYLSRPESIHRRIDIFIQFIPTVNFYHNTIEKLSKEIDVIPQDKIISLLSALINEIPNVYADSLNKLFETIDKLSKRTTERPISELSKNISYIANCIIKEQTDVKTCLKLISSLSDKRLSDEDIYNIFKQIFDKITSFDKFEIMKELIEYILQNPQLYIDNTKILIFEVFCREIFNIKLFDIQKFPNNEGVDFWKGKAKEIISSINKIDNLLVNVDAVTSCLLPGSKILNLNQKSELIGILQLGISKYGAGVPEHLLNVLISYLSTANSPEFIRWGAIQICSIMKIIDFVSIDKATQQKILTNLCTVLKTFENDEDKIKILEVLLKSSAIVKTLGEAVKAIYLVEIEKQYEPQGNHELATMGLIQEYNEFSREKQISLCGSYLGSKAFTSNHTLELIDKINEIFINIPDPQIIEQADKTKNPIQNDKLKLIEDFIANISLDEKAWSFFALLAKRLIIKLNLVSKKSIYTESINIIKTEDASHGVFRNRFTIINLMKGPKEFPESEVYAMFTNLLSSANEDKIGLVCDFLPIYYDKRIIDKLKKEGYKINIEQVLQQTNNEILKDRLNKLRNYIG